ncbi:CDP-alcohol phosphatidyltransferase family protein [Tateyamaria sp.]|nr:CDP-alcohol phosphatidyltransferase family protein [Tateyamaria sp.]
MLIFTKEIPSMATSICKKANRPAQVILVGLGTPIWGMSPTERLRRMFARLNVSDLSQWDGKSPKTECCYVISADYAFSQILLADLAKEVGTVLVSEGRPVAAYLTADRAADLVYDIKKGSVSKVADLKICTPDDLSTAYDERLRKREEPYVVELNPKTLSAVEQRTFYGSYKGVTDFVTLYFWPKPAIAVVRCFAGLLITPNMVTLVSLIFVLMTIWLFWNGFFIFGIFTAWIMTFLDTVDGKLARVTFTSSKFGNIFDHGIDLIHPPFWYWAWAVGAMSVTDNPSILIIAFWITVVGYVIQRIQEGIFIKAFGIEMHIWRKFDSWYRLFVARRNPNLAILTAFALFSYPAEGLISVAIWTLISLIVHSLQIFQAARAPHPLQSWLNH